MIKSAKHVDPDGNMNMAKYDLRFLGGTGVHGLYESYEVGIDVVVLEAC